MGRLSERGFKGIWIPEAIWMADLPILTKVLFAEIESLDRDQGCFASNADFEKFFGVTDRAIRKNLAILKAKNFISISLINGFDRTIEVHWKFSAKVQKSDDSETLSVPHVPRLPASEGSLGRGFKGIWIPKVIWLSPDLTILAKVLFAEVDSLDKERGCFASNAYFAKFFKVSPRAIRQNLALLKQRGFIRITIKAHFERTIQVSWNYSAKAKEKALKEIGARRKELHSKLLVHGNRGAEPNFRGGRNGGSQGGGTLLPGREERHFLHITNG